MLCRLMSRAAMAARLLGILAVFLVAARAQECPISLDCSSCVATEGCGWCSVTQECLAGSAYGPASQLCNGELSWQYGSGACTNCTLFEGCTDCLTHPDCKWCPGDADNLVGAACRSFSDMSDESCGDRGSACTCEDYDSCSHCTRHSPCQWCAEEDRCVDPTTSLLAACQPQSTCSCAQMRECDDCRVDLECAWCHDRRGCYNTTDFPSTCDVAETCSCTPSCQSIECGPYDGCGGSCGTCPSSRVCTAEGQCEKIPNAASNFIAGIAVGIVTMAVGVGTYWWFTRRKRDQSYTTIDTTVTSS